MTNLGGIKQYTCMVMLVDFASQNALFGLVFNNDP